MKLTLNVSVIGATKVTCHRSLKRIHFLNPYSLVHFCRDALLIPKNNTKISKTFISTNSSNILDDPKEIANKFNDYFVNVGPNLANTIKQIDNSSSDKYLKGNY